MRIPRTFVHNSGRYIRVRMKGKDLNFQVLQPKGVPDADLDCSGMSLTVAQNDGFCAQGVLF